MGFYDYKCTNEECNHIELDVKRRIIEDVSVYDCPKCGSEMRQLIKRTYMKLKGSGWAADGYSSIKKESKSE